jgi:hypothetical protein
MEGNLCWPRPAPNRRDAHDHEVQLYAFDILAMGEDRKCGLRDLDDFPSGQPFRLDGRRDNAERVQRFFVSRCNAASLFGLQAGVLQPR